MNKWWLLLIVLLCVGIGFAIFGLQQEQNPSGTGRPTQTHRIASLAPNLTEILFALGLGEKIVAVSSNSDHPPEAGEKKKVGTFWQPNIEAVIAARPDLVITLGFEQQNSVADSLNRLGYKVLTLKIEKIEELFTAIEKIGAATDCRWRADQLVKNIRNRINNLQMKLGSTNKVKVLWVVQADPLHVAGRNSFINELIELVGGENAIGPTVSQYPQIGAEELITCGVEIIIQSAMGTSNISEQQRAAEAFWSKWANLPAVKNNRIYVVDSDPVLRLGPRLPQGAEMIARCLHSEIYTQE